MSKKIKKLTLTNSALEEYKACPYRFYKKYILRQAPVEDTLAADFGTAIHAFIEGVMLDHGQNIGELMKSLHKKYKLPAYDFGSYSHFVQVCSNYVRTYVDENGRDVVYNPAIGSIDDEPARPLLETKLEAPIDEAEGLYISGTIDRIASSLGGAIYIFDTKTTSGMSYWTKNGNQKVHLLPQLTHYTYLAQMNGMNPMGCVIDLVSTNQRYPGFQRIQTQRSPERVAQWLAETKFYSSLIKQSIEQNLFPRNMGNSCMAFKGCPFMKHCMFPKDEEQTYNTPSYQGVFIEYED